jgi:hypothetical protein
VVAERWIDRLQGFSRLTSIWSRQGNSSPLREGSWAVGFRADELPATCAVAMVSPHRSRKNTLRRNFTNRWSASLPALVASAIV